MSNRIDVRLRNLRQAGETAVAPFVTVGFPDIELSQSLAEALVDGGADMLELGIPFSDPLADGPTVQRTSFQALQHGVSLRTSLDVLTGLRKAGVDVPLVFMGYYNPFLRFGLDEFAKRASEGGLDGVIVPDLPPEEGEPFRRVCEERGIHLIQLLAPTSTDERIALACKDARGFIYCVSLTGVTGARQELASGLSDLVGRIRRHTELPVLVGFGVSRAEHVAEIGRFADGAIVASALLDAIAQAPRRDALDVARRFLADLKSLSNKSR